MSIMTIPLLFAHLVGGLIVWNGLTQGPYRAFDESDLSIAQLIFLRVLCGPALWFYSIWQLLGYLGKRS